MPLTLDPILQARLDGRDRQPEIELLSSDLFNPIPFQGQSFGITSTTTFKPHILVHSTGLLGQVYVADGEVMWMSTDDARNQWTPPVDTGLMSHLALYTASYVSAVELANGDIGVVVMGDFSDDLKLWGAIITTAGVVVGHLSEIEDIDNGYEWRNPHVSRMGNDKYYLVYIRETIDTAWAIYARAATTWGTWDAASDITPSGANTAREIDNPSILQTDDGTDLFLFFDHVTAVQDANTIKNIFSAISTDYGVTWGTATARTNYTLFGSNGLDPIVVQKTNGTVWLIFYENIRVLHIDNTASGWVDGCSSCVDYDTMGLKSLHCDSVNGKIIAAFGNSQTGTKCLAGVVVIDLTTWSIDKVYNCLSTPAINSFFSVQDVINCTHIHGDGKYFAFGLSIGVAENAGHAVVCVIDHTVDTVTTYVIDDTSCDYGGLTDGLPPYNLPRNVEYDSNAKYGYLGLDIRCIRVDATRDRVYFGWDGGYHRQQWFFSYIELDEPPDGEGMYDMPWVTDCVIGVEPVNKNRSQFEQPWSFEHDRYRNYIILSAPGFPGQLSWYGVVAVLSEDAEGAIVKQYDPIDNGTAPRWALGKMILYGGAAYGTISYCVTLPHTDQRGMCRIDYVTDQITYFRPSFATADEYSFWDYALDETDGMIYAASQWGIAKFNTATGGWIIFNSDTVDGFVRPGESDYMAFVAYDAVGSNVIMGSWNDYIEDYLEGVGMFNENGPYNQLQYISADKSTVWAWGDQEDLSYYNTEALPTAVLSPDNVLWVIWNHIDLDWNVLYWDNDVGQIDISDDLVGSVIISWQLKRLNRLQFSLGNGYLYDPQNLLSTLSKVGQKGRKIHVRIGENIGGYVYWVNQGAFLVDAAKMNYKRGEHPTLQVEALGKTSLWREQQVVVSPLYEGNTPDYIINDILQDYTQLNSSEYDVPVFNSEHSIYYQWIDKSIWQLIEELCDHFFYAMYEDVNGVFTCREVDLEQAVDHEYTDQTQLTGFSPDDAFSNYTNRVRVIGESQDYTEVVHSEEMIISKSGTIGWWVKKTTEDIWFDEDKERQCHNVRLEVIHAPDEYGLLMDQVSSGDGQITVSYRDPYDKYITVDITVPDLTGAVIGLVIAVIGVGYAAIYCFWHCGPYIMAEAILCSLLFYILAAVAQYQYEVWGMPVGKVKTTIQYEANDIALQRQLNGEIVTEEITDPLCYEVVECRRVSEGNLNMLASQRRRLSFSKLAHLQDELLDKLKVYHPYSGEGMEVLVIGLTRAYTKGKSVIDKMTCWRYIP